MPVTARERLLATLEGRPTDRVPVWTLIPFGMDASGSFAPEAFHGYPEHDDWRARDPEYRGLVERMEREGDNFFVWRPPCMEHDQLFVPPARVDAPRPVASAGRVRRELRARLPDRELVKVEEVEPGTGHSWTTAHYCKSAEDARSLLDVPWEGMPATAGDFHALEGLLGERGLVWVTIPSPILAVCRLFDPTEFLVLTRTEPRLLETLLETAAARISANLRALLEQGVGPIIRFGGAEHATPPLMAPAEFDRLVVAYDQPLVELCKGFGRKTAVHCHGRLRHALRRFVEMGFDQTDPVEAAPDGDVSLEEAREMGAGRITLTGNVQMRDLSTLEPEEIGRLVRRIIRSAGPDRLVVSTTGTPLERMNGRLARNYHALLDAAREG
jgi:uroporphyrinogen-III decarboxylase